MGEYKGTREDVEKLLLVWRKWNEVSHKDVARQECLQEISSIIESLRHKGLRIRTGFFPQIGEYILRHQDDGSKKFIFGQKEIIFGSNMEDFVILFQQVYHNLSPAYPFRLRVFKTIN